MFKALQAVRGLEDAAAVLAAQSGAGKKLMKALHEFYGYSKANQAFIVNYGDRLQVRLHVLDGE